MKVNLANTKTFEPPAEGDYVGEVVEATAGTTTRGDAKIDLKWRIEDKGVEKTVFQTVAIAGEGAFRAEQLFIAVGMANTKEDVHGLEFDPEDLVGRTAKLRVKHRVWAEEQGGDGSVRGDITSMKRVASVPGDVAPRGGLFGKR